MSCCLLQVMCAVLAGAAPLDDEALRQASEVISRQPEVAAHWFTRAEIHARLGQHDAAISDYSEALSRDARLAAALDGRGNAHLKEGRIAESLADFDAAIGLEPQRAAGHWQRGIALYYAGRFDEGAEQFAAYQQVDDNDVENAVWRLMCQARASDLTAARRSLLKVRRDPRVPMSEIYRLFAGDGDVAAVLAAVEADSPGALELNRRSFYAHLYVGLYCDLRGETADARRHLETAVMQHRVPDYMWHIARVHAQRLRED